MSKENWPKDLKKTKTREAILHVLKNANEPLPALLIASKVSKSSDNVWPSTIYRSLEAFVESGIVRKITIAENDSCFYELETHEHSHYAICLSCHKIIKITNCPFDSYVPEIEDKDFVVIGHKMEIYGYCNECLNKVKEK